jgi:Na+-transporting methylmalonyl-CoA/oxaloacetate decarboxylase gamma subunit
MIKVFAFLFFLIFLMGCCCKGNEDFRTVPVTNNPHIVPNYGNVLKI